MTSPSALWENGKEGGIDREIRNEKILQKPWWWVVCLDQWTVSLCLFVLNGRDRRWSNSNHTDTIAPPLRSDFLKTLQSIILSSVAMAKYIFVPPIEINPWHNAVKRERVKHVSAADLTTEEWIRNYCKLHFLNRAQSLITPINETRHTFTWPIMWRETTFPCEVWIIILSAINSIFYVITYSLIDCQLSKVTLYRLQGTRSRCYRWFGHHLMPQLALWEVQGECVRIIFCSTWKSIRKTWQ